MKLIELKKTLADHAEKAVRFVLPTGSSVPPHAHVTEVAQVDKRFIDCGGTARTESICRMQTWFADDTEHRLSAGKLLKILEKSRSIIADDQLEVEIEHEAPFISQFPIEVVEARDGSVIFRLGIKHTDCLAKDQCGAPKSITSKAGYNLAEFAPLPSLRRVEEKSCCGGAC
ncbi:MAG TPA: DUF6428 family protein [Verrucomicrobiae bacterium]